MQPGQKIEIQLLDDGGRRVRLANVLVNVTFYTSGHLRYVFDLRPTLPSGITGADFAELDTQRKENGLYSLMDYNTPLTACDQEVEASVPGEAQLRKRRQGIEEWNSRTVPSWLLKWPVNGCLGPVQPLRVSMVGPVTHVDLVVRLPI